MTTDAPRPDVDASPDDAAAGAPVNPVDIRTRYPASPDGLEARDTILGRTVSIRTVGPASADELEREARFMARIDHGGIPTVHDFVRGPEGATLVTRRVHGLLLSDAIIDARAGTICPELADSVALMQMMLRVCDVLAAAHATGVVHRHLTPAAITLAAHGEVLIGGWDASFTLDQSPISVRYAKEHTSSLLLGLDDMHSDIRAVGACMFESLVRRPPTMGRSDPFADITPADGALLSPRVCALIRRAMGTNKAGGFRSMADLRRTIETCMAAELTETRTAVPGRFHGRKRIVRAVAAAIAVAAVGIAVVIVPHWRNPGDTLNSQITTESFSDESWRSRWSGSDNWATVGGRLVSTANDSARLTLRQRVSIPVAIEYTAQIQEGQRPGDLSVIWSESGAEVSSDPKAALGARTFAIQAGAWDNSYCGIFLQPSGQRLAYSTFKLQPGRDHHFRVEIDGTRFAMRIDGALVLEHRDRFPSTSGYISLLGWYPGKSFDDVRVLARPVLDRVPSSAMGDALYGFGHYDDAAAMYGRLAESGDIDGGVVQDAIFRKGMAERRAGKFDDASETWSRLTDSELTQVADAIRLEDLLRTGQRGLFLDRFRTYWRRSNVVWPELRQQWSAAASAIVNSRQPDVAFAEELLDLRQKVFSSDVTTGYETARMYLRLERFEDVLKEFPEERRTCASAMISLGRLDEAERLPYLVQMDRIQIAFMRGDYAAVVDMTPPDSYHRSYALCKMGKAAELRGRFAAHPAMLHLGQAQTLLSTKPPYAPNECLLALGRLDEAAGPPIPDLEGSGNSWQALAMLGRVEQAEAAVGDPLPWLRLMTVDNNEAATAARASLKPSRNMLSPWFPTMIIGPVWDLLQGDGAALDASLRKMAAEWKPYYGRRAWLFARAALGEATEAEVAAMPAVLEGKAWWLVASGVRAERQGQPAEARTAYAAFLDLPGHLRLLSDNTLDAPTECFVRWRLRTLPR